MQCKLYARPGEFLEDNRAFLLENEPLVQLNYGNASGHRDEPCHPGLWFGRYEEEGRTLMLFGNTLPWNVCLNAPQGEPRSLLAAKELARHMRRENIGLAGVTARKDLADAFIEAYGGTFTLRGSMDILVLREAVPPGAVPGAVRKTTAADLDLVVRWLQGFYMDIFGEARDPAEICKAQGERVNNGQYYLFETPQGQAVSMAAVFRDLPHGSCISGVYTPPEHRGKGYCQNTVAAICQEKLAAGKGYCTLFVNKKNPISNRVYKKIGFTVQEGCCEYHRPT